MKFNHRVGYVCSLKETAEGRKGGMWIRGNLEKVKKKEREHKSWNPFHFFSFFFLKIFFWCGPFIKSSLNLLQYCFCFMLWFFFGREACGNPHPLHWKTKSQPLDHQGSPSTSFQSFHWKWFQIRQHLICPLKNSYLRASITLNP